MKKLIAAIDAQLSKLVGKEQEVQTTKEKINPLQDKPVKDKEGKTEQDFDELFQSAKQFVEDQMKMFSSSVSIFPDQYKLAVSQLKTLRNICYKIRSLLPFKYSTQPPLELTSSLRSDYALLRPTAPLLHFQCNAA